MAETLRVVTSHPSSPGQGSKPQEPKQWRWPKKIDPGLAAIIAALIAVLFGGGGTILGRSTAPDNSHAITVTPTVTVTVTASPKGPKRPVQASISPTPTIWLNQLKVTGSGEVSPDGPHELLIKPAQNGNIITYDIDRKYKTLNLDVEPDTPTQPNEGTTFIRVFLDGSDYQDAIVGPGDQETNWIIPVSNVGFLELRVYGTTQDINLLVSGALIS